MSEQQRFEMRDVLLKLERNLEGYIAVAVMAVYGSIILWNILVRTYAGNLVIPGALTITLGLVTWMAWIAASWGIRKQSHLRFLLLRTRFPREMDMLSYVVEWVLWLVVNGAILWYSIPIFQRRMASGSATFGLRIPTFLFYLAIPVGFSLMLIRVVQMSVIITRKYRNGEEITPTSEI